MRIIHESPRGCGHRKEGGTYLVGEPSVMGTLPTCVVIDPPTPLDMNVFPFIRSVYRVDFDALLSEQDQNLWLVGNSKTKREGHEYEIDRYGMSLEKRLSVGLCRSLSPELAEVALDQLSLRPGSYPADYILAISRAGRGRRIARETALMQDCRLKSDWRGLLAACWRLADYNGRGHEEVRRNIMRLAVSVGASEDAGWM